MLSSIEQTFVHLIHAGGGKTTFFGALKGHCADSGLSCQVVSSDELKKGLDAALKQTLATDIDIIGYDKNIPDNAGLTKLMKVTDSIGWLFCHTELIPLDTLERWLQAVYKSGARGSK